VFELGDEVDGGPIVFTQHAFIETVFDGTTALKQTPFQAYVVDPTTGADESIIAISTCAP
jgi:hypothetical protein